MNRNWILLASLVTVFLGLECNGGAQNGAAQNSAAQEAPGTTEDDRRAKALALRVHRQAAAIDKLPRFHYRVHCRHGDVDTMRHVEKRSIDLLKKALDGPVLEKDWIPVKGTDTFAWDETHFLRGAHNTFRTDEGGETTNHNHRFWTKQEAWERSQGEDGPASFVRMADSKRLWKHLYMFEFGYLRATPHHFRWGVNYRVDQCISPVPPEAVSYRHVGTERFGGETCDVVESFGRAERLWIGRKSGRLRGILEYGYGSGSFPEPPFYKTDVLERIAGRTFSSRTEYANWFLKERTAAQAAQLSLTWNKMHLASNAVPDELIRFSDYREIAPGVWIPFHEDHSYIHSSDDRKGAYLYNRSELVVEEVKTDVDLSETIAKLMPKEGEWIQDQRYWPVWVNYEYRADRPEEEIQKLIAAKQQERAETKALLEQYAKPFEAMVGKPAPALPAKDWLGGKRPKLEGTPYLIHFWATWCGPCKSDLPQLKKLAAGGATVIGIHPPGTPADEVKKMIAENELGYPTLLVSQGGEDAVGLAGYPVTMYPYCIVVDAKGQVAAHGFLRSELREKFHALRDAARQPRDE